MEPQNRLYKILVISDYRDANSSRPEAEIFVALAGLGHNIHILSYPDAEYYNERFRSNGIKVIEAHPTRKASLSYIKYLRRLLQDEQYDFVHVFNSYGLTNAVWAMRGLASKLIAYRGYAGQTHWYDPVMYFKYFHPRVDQIICLSEDTRIHLARNMLGSKSKLTIIYKGHDPEWYQSIVPANRSELGFKEDDILLCCVANARPFKGIPYLIEAMNYVDHLPPVKLLLIGRDYDKEPIHYLISKSLYSKNIYRLGFREDSLSIVKTCDASVLASTHGEALTKAVTEAMCLGIPPIITEIGGNHGLVIDGDSGWVVLPADPNSLARAIEEMAGNKDERKRRGQNAKEHILHHFHTDNTVAEFIKLYHRMMPEGPVR